MAGLNDLPVELILDIIQELLHFNQFKPIIGQNAPWTSLDAYNASIWDIDAEHIDESDPLPPAPTSIHADILALRLTSSQFKSLCTPFAFEDLNICKDIGMPFDEFYDLIVKPYGRLFKTARILISEPSLSDSRVASILRELKNFTSLMLYHANFGKPFVLSPGEPPEESTEEEGSMGQTNREIVNSMATRSLASLGVYSHDIIVSKYWRDYKRPNIDFFALFTAISESPDAVKSLKHLDLVIHGTPQWAYDIIRETFTSLESFTSRQAFREDLPRFWEPYQIDKWSPNANLVHLKLQKCTNAYAPHIPNIVRHFASLKTLLISVCGSGDDKVISAPVKGWYSNPHALWKVRKPLDVFNLEHMDHWEIGVMGEIPTKHLIVANLAGDHIVRALQDDPDYFPNLEVVGIEPRDRLVGRNVWQFSNPEFDLLQQFCEKRSVTIIEGVKPTSRNPDHFWWR